MASTASAWPSAPGRSAAGNRSSACSTVSGGPSRARPAWRPGGGPIVVVLVKEEDCWLAYFCLDTKATAVEILEAMADRSAIEQTNKDVKEVWGAGQQQVRNLDSNIGCFNLNLWLYSLVE